MPHIKPRSSSFMLRITFNLPQLVFLPALDRLPSSIIHLFLSIPTTHILLEFPLPIFSL